MKRVHPRSVFTQEQLQYLLRCTTGDVRQFYQAKDQNRLRNQIMSQVDVLLCDLEWFQEAVEKCHDDLKIKSRGDVTRTIRKAQPALDKAEAWRLAVELETIEKQEYSRKRRQRKELF